MKTFNDMIIDFSNMSIYNTECDVAVPYLTRYAADMNTTPNALINSMRTYLAEYDDKGEPMNIHHVMRRAHVTLALYKMRRVYHCMLKDRKAA